MAKKDVSKLHEPGSVADGTAELESGKSLTREDALDLGKSTARENLKKEQRPKENNTREEIVDDAQDTAEENHEAEQERADDLAGNGDVLKNDTSKAAKEATAKSQLDPTGKDPITKAEVNRSATDADMSTGNKTAVSNAEAADRANAPGEAEENAPLSTAKK